LLSPTILSSGRRQSKTSEQQVAMIAQKIMDAKQA
jgi:hypothetical protein